MPNQGYLSEAGASLVDDKLGLNVVPKTKVSGTPLSDVKVSMWLNELLSVLNHSQVIQRMVVTLLNAAEKRYCQHSQIISNISPQVRLCL